MDFQVLGDAVIPLMQLLGSLDVESKGSPLSPSGESAVAFRAKKLAGLRALEAAWTKQFSCSRYQVNNSPHSKRVPRPEGLGAAARAVLGVLAHILNAAVHDGDGALIEASANTLATVLEECGGGTTGLSAVLSPSAVLRLCTTLALALPPPADLRHASPSSPPHPASSNERTRSEEELNALFKCISCVLGETSHGISNREGVGSASKSHDDDDDEKACEKDREGSQRSSTAVLHWFMLPGSNSNSGSSRADVSSAVSAWRDGLVCLLGDTEEGRGSVAQIVQASLSAARRAASSSSSSSSVPSPTFGWPPGRLPRYVCVGALTVLESLLALLPDHVNALWRPFLPGIASQLFRVVTDGSSANSTNESSQLMLPGTFSSPLPSLHSAVVGGGTRALSFSIGHTTTTLRSMPRHGPPPPLSPPKHNGEALSASPSSPPPPASSSSSLTRESAADAGTSAVASSPSPSSPSSTTAPSSLVRVRELTQGSKVAPATVCEAALRVLCRAIAAVCRDDAPANQQGSASLRKEEEGGPKHTRGVAWSVADLRKQLLGQHGAVAVASPGAAEHSSSSSASLGNSLPLSEATVPLPDAEDASAPDAAPDAAAEAVAAEAAAVARWKVLALPKLELVLRGCLAVARAHNSWRVRACAVAGCDLLLLHCRRTIGPPLVLALVDSLAVLRCEATSTSSSRPAAAAAAATAQGDAKDADDEDNDEDDDGGAGDHDEEAVAARGNSTCVVGVAARNALERLRRSCCTERVGGSSSSSSSSRSRLSGEWFEVWSMIQGRVSELTAELAFLANTSKGARGGGAGGSVLDTLKLLTGLVGLLSVRTDDEKTKKLSPTSASAADDNSDSNEDGDDENDDDDDDALLLPLPFERLFDAAASLFASAASAADPELSLSPLSTSSSLFVPSHHASSGGGGGGGPALSPSVGGSSFSPFSASSSSHVAASASVLSAVMRTQAYGSPHHCFSGRTGVGKVCPDKAKATPHATKALFYRYRCEGVSYFRRTPSTQHGSHHALNTPSVLQAVEALLEGMGAEAFRRQHRHSQRRVRRRLRQQKKASTGKEEELGGTGGVAAEEEGALAALLGHISLEVHQASVDAVSGKQATITHRAGSAGSYEEEGDDEYGDDDSHEDDFDGTGQDDVDYGTDEEEEEGRRGGGGGGGCGGGVAGESGERRWRRPGRRGSFLQQQQLRRRRQREVHDPSVAAEVLRVRWAHRVKGCDESSGVACALNHVLCGAARERFRVDCREQQRQQRQQKQRHVTAEAGSKTCKAEGGGVVERRVSQGLDSGVAAACRVLALGMTKDKLFTTKMAPTARATRAATATSQPRDSLPVSLIVSRTENRVSPSSSSSSLLFGGGSSRRDVDDDNDRRRRLVSSEEKVGPPSRRSGAGHEESGAADTELASALTHARHRGAWVEAQTWALSWRVEALGSLAMLLGEAFEEGAGGGGGLLMHTLYPLLGLASSSSSSSSTHGSSRPVLRQAAAATVVRIAAHVGLYGNECSDDDDDENQDGKEAAATGKQTTTTRVRAAKVKAKAEVRVESSEVVVARMLGANLDYIVDKVCEDLRQQANTGSSSSSAYGGGEEHAAATPTVRTPALGVLETILRYSDASAAQPLLRDVLASVTTEVDRVATQGGSSGEVLSLLRTCHAIIEKVPDHDFDDTDDDGDDTEGSDDTDDAGDSGGDHQSEEKSEAVGGGGVQGEADDDNAGGHEDSHDAATSSSGGIGGGIGGAVASAREDDTEAPAPQRDQQGGVGQCGVDAADEKQRLREERRRRRDKEAKKKKKKKQEEDDDLFKQFTHPHAAVSATAVDNHAQSPLPPMQLTALPPSPPASASSSVVTELEPTVGVGNDDGDSHREEDLAGLVLSGDFADLACVLAEFKEQDYYDDGDGEGGCGGNADDEQPAGVKAIDMEKIKRGFLGGGDGNQSKRENGEGEEPDSDDEPEQPKLHGSGDDDTSEEEGGQGGGDRDADLDADGLPFVPRDVRLVLDLLPRCGYFASCGHPLNVRYASVTLLGSAVEKLSGCTRQGVRRRLLPAIHTLWPALVPAFHPSPASSFSAASHRRRHRSLPSSSSLSSSSPLSSSSSSPLSSSSSSIPWAALGPEESALCAAACELVSSLATAAGDFLGFKFDDDLWPALRRLLAGLSRSVPLSPPSSSRVSFQTSQRRRVGGSPELSAGGGLESSGGGGSGRAQTRRGRQGPYRRLDETRLRNALFSCLCTLASLPQCKRFMVPVSGALAELLVPFLQAEGEGGNEDGQEDEEKEKEEEGGGGGGGGEGTSTEKAASAAAATRGGKAAKALPTPPKVAPRHRHGHFSAERLCRLLFALDGDAVWSVLWRSLSSLEVSQAHAERLAAQRTLHVPMLNIDLPTSPQGAASPPREASVRRRPLASSAAPKDRVLLRLLHFSELSPQTRCFS